MEPPAGGRPLVDAAVPSAPRIYDYLLGGKDNFQADRDLAEAMQAEARDGTGVRELALANRRFVLKAVTWSASMLGVSQFLDLGCGLPLRPAVHDAARDGCAEARVVYVDNDPMVLSHVAALQAGEGLGAALADVSDPAAALLAIADLGVIDLRRPCALIFGGTLSGMTVPEAGDAVAGFASALAPGSAVIACCARYDDEGHAERMAGIYASAGRWLNHSRDDVAGFLGAGKLRLIRGRVADVRCWPMMPAETPAACMLGAVGVKD